MKTYNRVKTFVGAFDPDLQTWSFLGSTVYGVHTSNFCRLRFENFKFCYSMRRDQKVKQCNSVLCRPIFTRCFGVGVFLISQTLGKGYDNQN